ncbi:unnamed protein product, partial [Meganyctiphanes norvegica]
FRFIMGKNHLKNTNKSGNPIYKKAGGLLKKKGLQRTKAVKTNLKKISIENKEAVKSLDKKLGSFHEAMKKDQTKEIKTVSKKQEEEIPPLANVDEAMEDCAK